MNILTFLQRGHSAVYCRPFPLYITATDIITASDWIITGENRPKTPHTNIFIENQKSKKLSFWKLTYQNLITLRDNSQGKGRKENLIFKKLIPAILKQMD